MPKLPRQQKTPQSSAVAKHWNDKKGFLTVIHLPHLWGLTAQLLKLNQRGVLVC